MAFISEVLYKKVWDIPMRISYVNKWKLCEKYVSNYSQSMSNMFSNDLAKFSVLTQTPKS